MAQDKKPQKAKAADGYDLVVENRKARHDFFIEETRTRKLLMHRREIDRFWGRVREKGYSLVPLRIYFLKGRAKVEIGLAKGKHLYDKRAAIATKTSPREME